MADGFVKFGQAPAKNGFVKFDTPAQPIEDVQPVAQDETAQAAAPAKPTGFLQDMARGGGQMAQSFGRTGQDLGIPGSAGLRAFGDKVVADNPADVNSLSDIIAHPFETAKEGLAEALPQVGLTMGSATAGAGLGAAAGAPFAGVGAVPGAIIGGAIGAFAPNLIQEYGGIRMSQDEQGVDKRGQALLGASAAAAIDMLGPEASAPRQVGTRIVSKVAKEGGEGLLKRVAKGALKEGATEAIQTGIERASADQSLTGDGAVDDYAVSAAKGAAGGGAVEGVMGGGKPKAARETERPISDHETEDLIQPSPTGPRNAGDQQGDLFPGAPETSPLVGTIQAAARKHGVDPQTLVTMARVESNLDPAAQNPKSSAGGLFQFTDGTAQYYGLTDKNDPAAASDAAARMTAENQAYLTKRLGRTPAPWELYLAHQQGPGGAAKLLANADKPAVDIVGEDALLNNGGTKDMTAGQFAELWKAKFEKAGGGREVLDSSGQPGAQANYTDEMRAADEQTAAGPPVTLLEQMQQANEGKATAEVKLLAKQVEDGLNAGNAEAVGKALDARQAKLDRALDKLDEEQKSLDAARGEHSDEEHAGFQAELDRKLNRLIKSQNVVAVGRDALTTFSQNNMSQGELDFQRPMGEPLVLTQPTLGSDASAQAVGAPAPESSPQQARGPRNGDLFPTENNSPTLFPEPSPQPVNPANKTALADQLQAEAFDEADQKAEASVRKSMLDQVLQDSTTRDATKRFVALLKRTGREPTLSDEESKALAIHANSDTTLGVPERAPAAAAETAATQPAAEPTAAPAPVPEAQAETVRAERTRKRAEGRAKEIGTTRGAWFQRGVDAVLGGQQSDVFEPTSEPMGKTKAKAFAEGKAFAEREMALQRTEDQERVGDKPAVAGPAPAAGARVSDDAAPAKVAKAPVVEKVKRAPQGAKTAAAVERAAAARAKTYTGPEPSTKSQEETRTAFREAAKGMAKDAERTKTAIAESSKLADKAEAAVKGVKSMDETQLESAYNDAKKAVEDVQHARLRTNQRSDTVRLVNDLTRLEKARSALNQELRDRVKARTDAIDARLDARRKAKDEAKVKNTADDMEAFDTRLEYALSSKMITAKQYQQISVLAEQGNTPVKTLDAMLDAAANERAKAFGNRESRLKPSGQKLNEFRTKYDAQRAEADPEGARVTQHLRAELDKLGLHDVGVKAMTTLGLYAETGNVAYGMWTPIEQLIRVAYSDNANVLDTEPDAQHTLNHEVLHALKGLGLFTDGEWRLAQKWALDNRPLMEEIFKAYKGQPAAVKVEEVIAEGYARWRTARQTAPQMVQFFRKIQNFLKALHRAFTRSGFKSAEDLFRAIESGEIGNRPRTMTSRELYRQLEQEGITGVLGQGVFAGLSSKLPNPLANAPKEVREPAEHLLTNVAGWAKTKMLWAPFTEDVAALSRKHIPSVGKFIELNSRSHALARKFEERLAEIKRDYQNLPTVLRGTGPGSVNDFLMSSRMNEAWGFKPTYLPNAKVDPAMKAKFDRLPAAAQAVVKDVLHFNWEARRELSTAVEQTINAEFDPLIAEATSPDETKDLKQRKQEALAQFSRMHAARDDIPYSPLKRSGEWVVSGMSQAYADAKEAGDGAAMNKMRGDANHYWVNFYDSEGEAKAARARVATKYDVTQHFERSHVTDAEISGKELYVAFGQLRAKIAKQMTEDPGNETAKQLYRLATDLYLQSLSDTSARKGELKADKVEARDPVTGEAIDMMKAFVSRGQATTHFVAAMHNAKEMHATLDAMAKEAASISGDRTEAERFHNELLWRYVHQLNRRPSRSIDKVVRSVSLYTLLLSPMYYATNLSQVEMYSVPVAAARVGYAKAQAAFTKAYMDVLPALKEASYNDRLRFDGLPKDVQGVLKFLTDRGRLDAGLATELGEWEANGNGVMPAAWNLASKILTYVPQNMETLNRVVTGIAAYRLAKSKGDTEQQAYEYASKLIYDTHGDYSGFNAPSAMSRAGEVGKVPFQFQKFRVIMATHMAKMIKNSFAGATPQEKWIARKSLAFTLAHTVAASGLVGLPAAETIGWMATKVLDLITGDDKDWDDWDNELHKWLKANAPGWFGDMLYKGAPYALLNADLSTRLGLGTMTSISPYGNIEKAATDRDTLLATAGQLAMGPLGSVVTSMADALGFAKDGDPYRAFESLAPVGLPRGALKAHRLATRGVESKSNQTLLKPEQLDGMDEAMSVLGLSTRKLADQSAQRSQAFEMDEHYKDETTSMKRRYLRAQKDGDTAKQAKVREDWKELQDARAEQGLKRQPLSTLLKAGAEMKREERRVINGVPSTPSNRRAIEQIAGD